MTKLKPGDKYLSIKLVGHDFVTAFPNEKQQKINLIIKGMGLLYGLEKKKE